MVTIARYSLRPPRERGLTRRGRKVRRQEGGLVVGPSVLRAEVLGPSLASRTVTQGFPTTGPVGRYPKELPIHEALDPDDGLSRGRLPVVREPFQAKAPGPGRRGWAQLSAHEAGDLERVGPRASRFHWALSLGSIGSTRNPAKRACSSRSNFCGGFGIQNRHSRQFLPLPPLVEGSNFTQCPPRDERSCNPGSFLQG